MLRMMRAVIEMMDMQAPESVPSAYSDGTRL